MCLHVREIWRFFVIVITKEIDKTIYILNAMDHKWNLQYSNSSCGDQEIMSSMDTSSTELSGVQAENHLWSQILFNTAGNPEGEMHNNGNKFLELLSSKNIACDYLKKLENSWELSNHTPLINNYNSESMVELEPNPPSNLVNNQSINAPLNLQSYLPYDPGHYHRSFPNIDDRRYQVSLNNSLLSSGTSDSYSFSNYLIKPTMEPETYKQCIKKQGYGNCTSPTMGNGRGVGASDGKKKRCGNSLETGLSKKSKIGNSSSSSVKAPTARNAEKISALQQLVSPFGKTDAASVLFETLNCIEYLHEQVQLLSDPYMNSRTNQDHNAWGGLARKDNSKEAKYDLRSRGLCLVPISCTPQTYRDNTGPDYWPTYRGCFYR